MSMMLATTVGLNDIPSILMGHWAVGKPYDVGQPIGLNTDQEDNVKGLDISFTQNYVKVCGKTVPIRSANVDDLALGQFLKRYNFAPDRIGLRGSHVTYVFINRLHSTNACGEFEDPGTHLLVSAENVVIETGNDYFPLKKGL